MTTKKQETRTYTFAVPALLARFLELDMPANAFVSHVDAEADGFTIAAYLYSFSTARAQTAAIAMLMRAANEKEKSLKTAACLIQNVAHELYVTETSSAERSCPDGKHDVEFYQHHKVFLDGDFAHVVAFSHFVGFPIVFHYGHNLIHPPFAPTESRTMHLFSHSRPPGIPQKHDHGVTQLFDLNVWQQGVRRFVNSPTPGRGRTIEQNGTSVFQVLGQNYYQLCLVPSDAHDLTNRDRIFTKLLEVVYRDFLDHNGIDPEMPEATSETLAVFGENQASKILSELGEELKEADEKMKEVEQKFFELFGKRNRLVQIIQAMSSSAFIQDLHNRLPSECTEIQNIEGVASVHLIHDGIQVKTKPIVIEHENAQYNLGPFTIHLEGKSNPAVWSEIPLHPKGHHHPHIDRQMLACYGNVTLAITKHMTAFRYADTIRLVLRWLNTYNPDTTLIPIEGWMPLNTSTEHEGKE